MTLMDTVVGDERLPRWTSMGRWLRAVSEYHDSPDEDFRAVVKKLARCAKKLDFRSYAAAAMQASW